MKITRIQAREVFDSRGRPTLEAEVTVASGQSGRMIVPSGASTGKHEALELRDGDLQRYNGLGVKKAVENVNRKIAPALLGRDLRDQGKIDQQLIDLDGTPNKANLGANALLGVSVACAKAAAAAENLAFYRYLGSDEKFLLPMPMINMISGGMHANRSLDLQDFLIIPVGADSFHQAMEMATSVRSQLRQLLDKQGFQHIGLADEGGFGPPLDSHQAAFDLLLSAIEQCGFRPGEDIAFAIDVAASQFYHDGQYHLQTEQRQLDAAAMVELLADWTERYPLISIEDGLAEDDWHGWKLLTEKLGAKVQLIGDDLLTTNPQRLRQALENDTANAILVKMNQIGTLTETIAVLEMAKAHDYATIVSARSGETEDTTIADLAVATAAGQIKIGSLATSERMAKYNQLLRIENELAHQSVFSSRKPFR